MKRRLLDLALLSALLAVLGMLGWLSLRFDRVIDLTAAQRNSVSPEVRALLAQFDGPLRLTAWVSDPASEVLVRRALERYQRVAPNLVLDFANPDLQPERARAEGVRRSGVLVLHYGARRERLTRLDEASLAAALQRLLRSGEQWVVMLEGHGEPAIDDRGPQGVSAWHEALRRAGVHLQPLLLARSAALPDNARVLVLFPPERPFTAGEQELLRDWLARGGNLLWLQDPGPLNGLEALAADLPVALPPGVVVDANARIRRLLGIDSPAVVPVLEYADHPATRGLDTQTLFPLARAVEPREETGDWQVVPLLRSLSRTWVEQGPLEGEVGFDLEQGDLLGPVPLALALERPRPGGGGSQRVVVVGDSQFLRNAWLARGANRELALNLIDWLLAEDALIGLAPQRAPDARLDLDQRTAIGIAVLFLFVLPAGLLGFGLWQAWRRRRRKA